MLYHGERNAQDLISVQTGLGLHKITKTNQKPQMNNQQGGKVYQLTLD